MPITPLHGLAIMLLYFKDKRRIDPLALAVSSTFIDLEILYYFFLGEPLNHRMWHGFALALTVYPVLITFGVYMVEHFFEGKLWYAYNALRLKPNQVKYPLLSIYLCSIVGGFSHVFLDMFTHEIMPYVIYPLAYGNPFYIGQASIIVDTAVLILAILFLHKWLSLRGSFNLQKEQDTAIM
jgi:drug/metabolite transporter (DMT)-like permease